MKAYIRCTVPLHLLLLLLCPSVVCKIRLHSKDSIVAFNGFPPQQQANIDRVIWRTETVPKTHCTSLFKELHITNLDVPHCSDLKMAIATPPKSVPDLNTAVIFGHGFLQAPRNYNSTLTALAEAGLTVIAPEPTPRFVLLTKSIPLSTAYTTSDNFIARFVQWQFRQTQTALIIDLLRCAEYANCTLNIKRVMMSGHSLGGGCSLVALSLMHKFWPWVVSAAVLSPQLGLQRTALNQVLYAERISHLSDLFKFKLNQSSVEKYFNSFVRSQSPELRHVDLLIVGAEYDTMVPFSSISLLAKGIFDTQQRNGSSLDIKTPFSYLHCLLAQLRPGDHLGFEDFVTLILSLPEGCLTNKPQLKAGASLLIEWFNGQLRSKTATRDLPDEVDANYPSIEFFFVKRPKIPEIEQKHSLLSITIDGTKYPKYLQALEKMEKDMSLDIPVLSEFTGRFRSRPKGVV